MLTKTLGTLPSQAKAQKSFPIQDSGINNYIIQPDSYVKGSKNVSYKKEVNNQDEKPNVDKISINGHNPNITLNPEDSPFKYNIMNTTRRHKTSVSFQNENVLIQSKISTQLNNQNQPPITHINPLHFNHLHIPSSIHYIGVKRQPKCQKSWLKRFKGMELKQSHEISFMEKSQDEEKISYQIMERLATNKSQISQRKWSQSQQKLSPKQTQRYQHNGSVRMSRSGIRDNTKRIQQSEYPNACFLRVSNLPPTQQSPLSNQQSILCASSCNSINFSVSRQNPSIKRSHTKSINHNIELQQIYQRTFTISPSKKDHFENINNQINNRMVEITTQFENQITTSRLNYHNRLKYLKSKSPNMRLSQSQSLLTNLNSC